MLWLVLVPLVTLIVFSFRSGTPWQPGDFTLQHYVKAYTSLTTYSMFFNTAVLAIISTLIAVSIAVLFAFLLERTDLPFVNLAWALLLVPMALPGILFAMSWVSLLSPKMGILNVWLRSLLSLFGFHMTEGPLNILQPMGNGFS